MVSYGFYLSCLSSPPYLPLHCTGVSQFLCGPLLPSGQGTAYAKAALGHWLVCACTAWLEEERQRGSGELVLVSSLCDGRGGLFQLCFSLLGHLMSFVLCGQILRMLRCSQWQRFGLVTVGRIPCVTCQENCQSTEIQWRRNRPGALLTWPWLGEEVIR